MMMMKITAITITTPATTTIITIMITVIMTDIPNHTGTTCSQ